MDKIPMCPTCGNTHQGDSAKRCSYCKKVTCQKCSFTGCKFCGSMSTDNRYIIGK
jgi:hypothetical protein